MQKYSEYAPTTFDCKGLNLDDQQDWLVLLGQNRDSGHLEQSNFEAATIILGGEENKNIEIHRFGHWACGWFEILIVKPDTEEHKKAIEIEKRLDDYPLLDEEDFCQREYTDYQESWEQYGASSFVSGIIQAFELSPLTEDFLQDMPRDVLNMFYEYMIPSGEHYYSESSGVCLPINSAVENMTRENLAKFIFNNRHLS